MKRLTVVVDADSWDAVNESWFFCNVILSALNRPVDYLILEPGKGFDITDDVLIFNFANRLDDLVREYLYQGKRNIGMVPWCHSNMESRRYVDDVDYVLRPFWAGMSEPNGRCKEVAWFPVGYKAGVGPRLHKVKPFSERKIEMFFAGVVGDCQERKEMMAATEGLPGMFIDTGAFNAGGVNTYRTRMADAKFALCPRGSNADAESMRIYEALELGAIPISLSHSYIENNFRGKCVYPIVLDSWSSIREVRGVESWLAFQAIGVRGWSEFKKSEAERIAAVIDRSFEMNS